MIFLSLYWLLPNACWCCCAVSIVELWHFHSVGVDLLENNILSPFICLEFGMSLQQSIFRLCVFFKEKPDTPNHVSISFLVKITCHFYGGGTLPEKKKQVCTCFFYTVVGCFNLVSLYEKRDWLLFINHTPQWTKVLSGWPLCRRKIQLMRCPFESKPIPTFWFKENDWKILLSQWVKKVSICLRIWISTHLSFSQNV